MDWRGGREKAGRPAGRLLKNVVQTSAIGKEMEDNWEL